MNKQKLKRILRLLLGLFLYALGTVFIMRADLGYGPWEVFQAGLTNVLPITIGQSTILVSVVIVLADLFFKEKIGIGTLLNMLLIGLFMDWILASGFIPLGTFLLGKGVLLVSGLFIIAFGSYFYIGSGFGAGPRDSLMVSIRRHTGLPVGISRFILEFSAAAAGYLLGGPLGLGTVITAFGIGICIQIVFHFFSFETTQIVHEDLAETFHLRSKSDSETEELEDN
ncbi:hypothetical protein [Sinanaerobacter sp. ZZT-01]|uniref:YczE/YyaS/YitT family protein n=1 Tax=Sinanaerobacter sp. ZZT-01 TaxID=3111540 RepID=UPI002D77C223|nr:hypothetical protein [Sinanaerobacter sp. ZZT-01]WRR94638.1 hypothetical protein U5921_05870 [Sinanaerobacter sp. ZZT-01]